MENLNIDLEDYKLNELFNLAAWLHGEEFHTSCLTNKKKDSGGYDCRSIIN